MSLYPTKTRLALLQAVADGDILRSYGDDRWMGAKVNARVAELAHAGWIRLVASRYWQITSDGQKVLDAGSSGSLAAVTA